eukprot:SAG11_NODE_8240_length_1042_cov_1.219512_2_plen_35_part_01
MGGQKSSIPYYCPRRSEMAQTTHHGCHSAGLVLDG